MDLTQLIASILFLAASMCRGEIVTKTLEWEQSMARVTDILVNVITSCHKGRVNGVGLAGNIPSSLYKTLSAKHSIPTVLFPNVGKYIDYTRRPVPEEYKQPLNLFVIEAENYEKLYTIVRTNIRHTIWWNNMASFFIIDASPGCAKYKDLLYTAWTFDMLNALVLCSSHKSGRIMFSYNPFTSKAPVSWQHDNGGEKSNERTLSVFGRDYRENETIMCDDMMYDKMSDLGGYPIGIKGYREDYSKKIVDTRGRGDYAFETRRRSVLGTLLRCLNATVTFIDPVSGNWQAMNAMPDGLQYSLLNDLKLTYPHRQVEASIITQFRGHKSESMRTLSIIDADTPFGIVGVCLISLMFVKTFVHHVVVPALRNLVRATCKATIVNWPDNSASRISLGCVLLFASTIQTIFHGHLASRLTKTLEIHPRNVESIRDLEEMGYTKICGKKYYGNVFEGTRLEEKFIVNDDEVDCIGLVKNDSSAAYIGRSEGFVIDLAENFGLHVSGKPVEMNYVGFPIYREWAMEERANAIISRMVEADGLELWEMKTKGVELNDAYARPIFKWNVDFKKLELHELTFALVILGAGLVCATTVFIIELLMGYKCLYGITIWRRGKMGEGMVEERSPEICVSLEDSPEVCPSLEDLPKVCLILEDFTEVFLSLEDLPEVSPSLEGLPEVCPSVEGSPVVLPKLAYV